MGVDGREGGGLGESSTLKLVEGVLPGGSDRGEVGNLKLDEGVSEEKATEMARELCLC